MHRARAFFFVCAGVFLLAAVSHFAAKSAPAQGTATPDVAILTGELPDGGTIPLPHYTDGSEALESECRWMVSVRSTIATNFAGVWCFTTGRVVSVGAGGNSSSVGVANYMIIATRSNVPTPAAAATWGGMKARYRQGAAATPQDR